MSWSKINFLWKHKLDGRLELDAGTAETGYPLSNLTNDREDIPAILAIDSSGEIVIKTKFADGEGAWTAVAQTGDWPNETYGCAMGFYRKFVYVLHGYDSTNTIYLWRYDTELQRWTDITSSVTGGPSTLRWNMGYCVGGPRNDWLFFIGGWENTAGDESDECWIFDMAEEAWYAMPDFPQRREGQCAVWDPKREKLWVFWGGKYQGGQVPSWGHAYVWDMATNNWSAVAGGADIVSARFAAMGVYDENIDKIVLYGGAYRDQTSGIWTTYNQLIFFDPDEETTDVYTESNFPERQAGYMTIRDSVYHIHFGSRRYSTGLRDFFDSSVAIWSRRGKEDRTDFETKIIANSTGSARDSISGAVDTVNERVYIFGGYTGSSNYNTLEHQVMPPIHDVDYLYIINHNLASCGAQLKFEGLVGSSWEKMTPWFAPQDDADIAIIYDFAADGKDAQRLFDWKLTIKPKASYIEIIEDPYQEITHYYKPIIGLLAFGPRTELEYASAAFDPDAERSRDKIIISRDGFQGTIIENYHERRFKCVITPATSTIYEKLQEWWEERGRLPFVLAWEWKEGGTKYEDVNIVGNPERTLDQVSSYQLIAHLVSAAPNFHNPLISGGAYRKIVIDLTGRVGVREGEFNTMQVLDTYNVNP